MAKLDINTLFDPTKNSEIVEPKTTGFWLTLGSLVFVLGGIFILQQDDGEAKVIGWGTIAFFGLCLLVGLFKFLGKPDTLKLDQDGFVFTSLGRTTRLEWGHVAGFGVYSNGPGGIGNKMVGMTMTDAMKTKATAIASAMVGYDGALPTAYGIKPTVLADALQKRLEAYQARQ